jgi:hypothetical protein
VASEEEVLWICRRRSDYDIPLPADRHEAPCADCGEILVHDGFGPGPDVPTRRVCWQCVGITPLPFTPPSTGPAS